MNPIKIFYSYSAEDRHLKDELERHLGLLIHNGLIETWDRNQVVAGDNVSLELVRHFRAADVILPLISPDYLFNQTVLWEIEGASRRHRRDAVVLPVLVRPSQWKYSLIGDICALPFGDMPVSLWRNRDLAWLTVAEGVRRIAEAIRLIRTLRENNTSMHG